MPKIGNDIPYSEKRCNRCSGKRKVAKTWTEKRENSFSPGFMILHHTQVICTNKECQAEFEEIERIEREKREARLAKNQKHKSITIAKK